MKTKNPLYVVKGSTVQEARNVFDMVLKKFNLEPAFHMLVKLVNLLLKQVSSYHGFMLVKTMVDRWIEVYYKTASRFGMV